MRRGQPIPQKVRVQVAERSQGYCEGRVKGCTLLGTEMDHIKSRARGGSNQSGNIRHLCHNCHQKKTENKPEARHLSKHSWEPE